MARIHDILANVDIDNEDPNNAIRLTNELTRTKHGLTRTLLKLTQFMRHARSQTSPTNGTDSMASCIATLGHRRRRRGLLNVIGHLGKSLFGVATTDDNQALKQAIKEPQAGNLVLYHNQHKFLSVFDKTRDYIEHNNDHIQDMEIEMCKLFQIANEEANRTNRLRQSLNSLVLALKIDLNIQQKETVLHTFLIQKQPFHHQKVQLERGWLTEDILTSRILNFVLRQVQAQHMKTLTLVWYYQHLRVTPLWQYQQKLVYKVMIPGLSRDEYLHYHLWYFGFPVGSDHLCRIEGKSNIAVNIINGYSFDPSVSQCLGSEPAVCIPDKLEVHKTCEARLVSRAIGEGCKISITSMEYKTLELYQDGERADEVILVGCKPTTVTQCCLGQATHPLLISKPTIIYVNHTCNLEVSNWWITSIKRLTSELTTGFPVYPSFPRLNFTWPSNISLEISNQVRHGKHVALDWNDLPTLVEPTFTHISLGWWDDYGWQLLLGLVMLSLSISAIIVLICLYNPKRICFQTTEIHPTLNEPSPVAPSIGDKTDWVGDKVAVSYWAKNGTESDTPISVLFKVPSPRHSKPYEEARILLDCRDDLTSAPATNNWLAIFW